MLDETYVSRKAAGSIFVHPVAEEVMASPALLLLEELNHRVINEFTEAISTLSLAQRASDSETQAALRSAAARLQAHAEAHRALMPPLKGGRVNLAQYLSSLCAALASASLADRGVQLTLRIDDMTVAAERSWRIGLVIVELVRNAWRHGFAGGAGAIIVRVAKQGGTITCVVGDNGRGGTSLGQGRGQQIIRSIAAELGGTVDWFLSPAGSLARLQIPAADDASV